MKRNRALAGVFVFVLLAPIRSSTVAWSAAGPGRAAQAPRLPFVHSPGEGEALAVPNGEVVIHVDPGTGSPRFALGTQTLRPGAGIGLHVHEQEDEVLFIHRGNGVGLLGDDRTPVVPGSTIFVPKGVWHGVDNPEGEVTLLWVVSPPGLESYFREVGSPPGEAPKILSSERIEEIRRKHGMRGRPR
jgi:mannose-6-phosphate isomerase-like protein (cupin superfamily)